MKGERQIDAAVEAFVERESYKPIEGEEQTPERTAALRLATASMKLAFAALNGGQLGEVRRRLAARGMKI